VNANEKRTKQADEIFCQSCGEPIKREAVLCVHCGVPTNATNKSKTVAVLLAVFLGAWSWLYTYQRDAWKFWVNLGLVALTYFLLPFAWGIIAWLWAVIDQSIKPSKYFILYPSLATDGSPTPQTKPEISLAGKRSLKIIFYVFGGVAAVVLILLVVVIILGQTSAPFIYTLW